MTVVAKESQTKFPKVREEDMYFTSLFHFKEDDVLDWFKRCIEDIPTIPLRDVDYEKEYFRLSDWMFRWFEQFMEDKP